MSGNGEEESEEEAAAEEAAAEESCSRVGIINPRHLLDSPTGREEAIGNLGLMITIAGGGDRTVMWVGQRGT